MIWQPSEAPQETKEAKQTVAEVKADTNGNEKQNGHPEVAKKKLNKRERKEARQQKNGKALKAAEKTVAQEPEEGKKKKKDRKRKHSGEEDGGEEQNGAENKTSSKKTKTGEAFSKTMLFSLQRYMISSCVLLFYGIFVSF